MTKKEIRDLRDLLKFAKMEGTGFGMPYEFVTVNRGCNSEDSLPIPVTNFIKERTRIWRQSWVIPIIERLLIKYDPEYSGEDLLEADR